jgi:hypothetical protein
LHRNYYPKHNIEERIVVRKAGKKKERKEGRKGLEDKEEDLSSYWMILRK